jgi:predicted amidohydrolase
LAAEERLEICSFPESLLTGYFSEESRARENAFSMESPQIAMLLRETSEFATLFMVGFNELRGERLFNTVVVVEKGSVIGRYSKAFPIFDYFAAGREFPVFQRNGVSFGVVICADGGYIEPARILALKGARIVFAPHYNYVSKPIAHYQKVRNDHRARAVENNIYFVRGNNVVEGRDKGIEREGDGYGDSYVMNPQGEIVASAGLYAEILLTYNLDPEREYAIGRNRSLMSLKALGPMATDLARDLDL